MGDNYEFKSCFAVYINQLIAKKHNEGFLYDTSGYILTRFDRFCLEKEISEAVITKELVSDWGRKRKQESKSTLGSRISVLRQLSLYMCSLGIDCYIPSGFSAKSHSLAYVLTEDEITAFFNQVDSNVSKINADRFNRLVMEYKVLFRMIFCCGLRVSEARNLSISDLDFSNGKAIIRQSKGRKDRIVFLPKDLCVLSQEYLLLLGKRYGIKSELLFPAADPQKALQVASINKKFHDFWDRTIYSEKSAKDPTVHSLRHSFVVIRMNKWMESDIGLNGMIPYLSKFLGHTSVEDTFYYYHQIESAFKIVRMKDTTSNAIIPEVIRDET